MMRRMRPLLGLALVALLIAGTSQLILRVVLAPTTITAEFTRATGIYPGDEVRVAGLRVGHITDMQPGPAVVTMTLRIDHGVSIPADARAVIVAPNLVAARYVQLTPPYGTSGPTMVDGARIPVDRTAVPVEWDQVKEQLTRLATDLGPRDGTTDSPISRFIGSAADAMDGNGAKLRQTLAELSGAGRIIASGSGDLVTTLRNLQVFVSALRDSSEQVVEFQDRFATLTSLLNDRRSDLDGALTNLSAALVDVQRFVAGSRSQLTEQVQRLGNVTQNVVDNQLALKNVLHSAPTAFANGYNSYSPVSGTVHGTFVVNNLSSLTASLCQVIGGIGNVTAPETAKLCGQYLGPALNSVSINNLPFPINPYLSPAPSPDDLIYSDPKLAAGSAVSAASPPEMPPAVSAYTGAGDVAPPPGYVVTPPPSDAGQLLLPAEATPNPGVPPISQPGEVPSP